MTKDEPMSPACAACPAPRGCFPAPCGLYWQRQAFKQNAERDKFSQEAADLTFHISDLQFKLQTAINHITYLMPLAKGYATRQDPPVPINQDIIRDADAFSARIAWGGEDAQPAPPHNP